MTKQPIGALIFALAVAMAPLLFELPPWAVLWSLIAWSYILLRHKYNWPQPSHIVRLLLFCLGVVAVLLSSGMRFDGGDFITLLAVMAGIKPLEVQSYRDSMVTVFLACFLTITSLFVFESLAMTLYLFVSVWVTTGVLVHINDPNTELRQHFRLSARLILVAIPLMLLLFLLFPRLSGSFWGTPWSRQAHSGFSNTLRIGDVSRLALNNTPAFSASFTSSLPRTSQLYWRGIVFQRFDGRNWSPASVPQPRQTQIQGTEKAQYTIMLEPHGYRTLFALDLPLTAHGVATVYEDQTLHTRLPVRQRFNYNLTSILDAQEVPIQEASPLTLKLPPGKNPQAVALGKLWAEEFVEPRARMQAGLQYFKEHDFSYTLQPGTLGTDSIDDFLFQSRKGFCEHYAASYAVLMRAAGIPARIVGGYQGGRWNGVGKFFTIRQSDAHVWCELWFEREGWVRVDPTFVVAPERFDQVRTQETMTGGQQPGQNWLQTDWISMVTMTWEAVNIRWNMWFMGFSAEDQIALLQKMGLSLGRQGGWLLVMVLPSLFILSLLVLRWIKRRLRRAAPRDQVQELYTQFLQKTARAGLAKLPHQGPLDYAAFLRQNAPKLHEEVEEITRLYIELRYRRQREEKSIQQLRHCVQNFQPHP